MKKELNQSIPVPADPSQWSEKSQRSVSFGWTKEYQDIKYSCWHCGKAATFSAADQKRAFEVKKTPVDQRRILCPECWKQSEDLTKQIVACEEQWQSSKAILRKDKGFLERWLQLLVTKEHYARYRANTAAKRMLEKLLNEIG
jgi:hypothetical protein